ncbi:MAG TPA: helix-hairpin-helix domain-containing protein [Kofleriaceae bacterium]|nr:helix-hairpin-helix domain-containing protein [Kofleriaceae bacterium]
MIATPERNPDHPDVIDLDEHEPDVFDAPLRSYAQHRLRQLARYCVPVLALMLLVVSMDGRWRVASAQPTTAKAGPPTRDAGKTPSAKPRAQASAHATSAEASAQDESSVDEPPERPIKKPAKDLVGKINLNTANEGELMRLPTVGPAKADRIVTWRKKNGGFRRVADIRRVKGFGYKTFKRLEPFLDVKGETTLH